MKVSRIAFVPLLVTVLMLAPFSGSGSDPRETRRALDSIQPSEVYSTCKILASAEFAGRLTGHAGYSNAAQWAARKFKEWGLKPMSAAEGYLQGFPAPYTLVDEADMTLLFQEKGEDGKETVREVKLEADKDFLPLLFTDSGRNEAGMVFAGWGISAPDLGYDDYAGLEVKGRFVLFFRGTPDPGDRRYEDHDQHRVRMKTARDKGALGVVYLYPEVSSNPNGDWLQGFTPAEISEKTADLLFKQKGLTAAQLKKDLGVYKRPLSFDLNARLRYGVVSRHFPAGLGYNVVGWLEGRDPALKGECLMFGAHLDHCGRHLGIVYPGANDNASGSATVMEIARAFARLGRKPRRSVVFVLFGGEEMGLLGSKHFAANIPPQFKSVAAMFNFDMTGAGDGAWCGVSAEPPALKESLEEADRQVNILRGVRVIRHVGVRSSDHAPFFLKGIPVASFGSNGPHLAYHQAGDTIYRINPDIMADIARVAFLAGLKLAER
ncbi:MAG: hypothetical protein A2Y86_07000 [Candidatus Aminicenantes bacterium RBG_13_62_12]|nr:MAG: hypothetical protein A2Y86_07000 [Candidatus Aminicenantes bacterium RBG_13_62_12]